MNYTYTVKISDKYKLTFKTKKLREIAFVDAKNIACK